MAHGTRASRSNQEGFTLVELMVALALIAIMFMGLAAALTASMAGTADSRRNQQSADLLNERIEYYRSMSYASILVKTPTSAEIAGDARVSGTAPNLKVDVDGTSGNAPTEKMLTDLSGVVLMNEPAVIKEGAIYRVRSYVTVPVNETTGAVATQPYKRVTVTVSWTQGGTRHERQATTFVAQTQRGLPLPDFTFKDANPDQTYLNGDTLSQLNLYVGLTNRGARDSWKFTVTGASWSWEYYRVATAGDKVDTATSLSGEATGPLATDQTFVGLIHVDKLPSSGGTFTITVRATSTTDPTVYKEVSFPVVVGKICSGCTYVPFYLHNTPTSAACNGNPCTNPNSTWTALKGSDLYMDLTAPKWAGSPPDFDTDVSPAYPGRWLQPGGNIATTANSSNQLIDWKWDATSSQVTVIAAKAFYLNLCAQNPTGVNSQFSVTAQVMAKDKNGNLSALTDPLTYVSGSPLSDAQPDCYTLTLTNKLTASIAFKSSGNNYRGIFVRVVSPNPTPQSMIYDTTEFSANLQVPTP